MINQAADTGEDRAALERHAVALRQYFRRRLGNEAEVQDMVQEVFVRLLNRQPRDPIDNLSGYIFHVAANLLRERARTLTRRSGAGAPQLSAGLLEGDEDFSPERIHSARQAWEQVERGLRELPDRVRSVFVLNRFEEMTGVQIARHLGVSVSTVEKDMIRAILHLKGRLQ